MPEFINTYCPACDAEVRAALRCKHATLTVRGDEVFYTERVAICPTCGTEIGDARIEGDNLESAYAAYRETHGILSPDEIQTLRKSYGLSLREFSRFLGFGEQTVYRYERGDVPDLAHNTTMLSARSIEGGRLLLSQNRNRLAPKSIKRIEQRLNEMADAGGTTIQSFDFSSLASVIQEGIDAVLCGECEDAFEAAAILRGKYGL